MTRGRSRMRSRRGMHKSLKMRWQCVEYAVRNCAAPTNGARIRKGSRSHKFRWSRSFASAKRREPVPGPRADECGARPLSGVRVLDLTRVLAGPTCARTLAEHGAEVLHVRSPKLPSIEPFVIDTNPGKRSCFLISIATKTSGDCTHWCAMRTCSRKDTGPVLSRGGVSPRRIGADAAGHRRGIDRLLRT